MNAARLIKTTFLTGICIGLLTGCSWLEDWPPKGSQAEARAVPKPPESKIMQTSEGTWIEPDNQAQPAQQASAAPSQSPQPMGLAVDPSSAERIAKLEETVNSIRGDLDMMMPALTRLAEAQSDLQKALGQVEPSAGAMVQGGVDYNNGAAYQPQPVPLSRPPAQAAAPVPVPAPRQMQQQPAQAQAGGPQPGSVAWYEQQEQVNRQQAAHQVSGQGGMQQPPVQQQAAQMQPPPPQQQQQQVYNQAVYQPASYGGSAGPSIINVRFGEHTDKTRLVFDASDKVAFNYDLDNNERLLVITLPGTGWGGAQGMPVNGSPLVASYNVIPDNAGGHQVIVQLKQPAKVLWAEALTPSGPQGNRIVLDLAPL